MFLAMRGQEVIGGVLNCEDEVIRGLAVVFLKALALFDSNATRDAVPEFKRFLMEVPDDGTQKYGFEYGGAYTYLTLDFPHLAVPGSPNTLLGLPVLWSTGMIQEFLQQIVENRRESDYLVENISKAELDNLGFSEQELQAYKESFMELDPACRGLLDADGVKVLMAAVGTDLEEEESQ
eukprot:gene31458-40504_t